MCGIISIKEYEKLAARGGNEYGSYEIVDRFTGPRRRKGIIVKGTSIVPAGFFAEGDPERRNVSVWAITSRDGTRYAGFCGDEAIEEAQAYMAEKGFVSTTPATPIIPTADQEPEPTLTVTRSIGIANLDKTTEEEEDALLASLR